MRDHAGIKTREPALDVVRTVAIILVVLNHAVELVYEINAEGMLKAAVSTRIMAFSLFTFGRLGVPLFLMLTGYLLLSRTYDSEGMIRFYKRNFIPLLVTWEIWVLLYNIFICLYYRTPFSIISYLKSAFFIKKVDLPQAWYIPAILGIYLFIPLVAKVLQNINKKLLLILAAVVFVYFFAVPSVNLYKSAQAQLNLYFSGGAYGLYMIAGYYLKTYPVKIEKKTAWILPILGVCVFFALTVFTQVFITVRGQFYPVWYDFIFLLPAGILLFMMMLKIQKVFFHRVFYRISISAFGIYLVHELLLLSFVKQVSLPLPGILKVIVLTFGAVILSYIVVELLSLIPKVDTVLFLRKK